MRPIIRLLLGSIALILLTSCGADPRKEAQAYATRSEANQEAFDRQIAREQSNDLHQYEMDRKEAKAAAIDKAANAVYGAIKIFGPLAVAVACLALAASFWTASRGIARAAVTYAELRANLIHMDKDTRTYPMLRHVHGTRYALANPNTESVVMLDVHNESDRQLLASFGATQLNGAVAQEARLSQDPAGLAMMNPAIINYQEDGLYIGDEYFENAIPLAKDETS